MTARLSMSEIKTVIFQLGLDSDEIPSNTKSELAENLILVVERKGMIFKLIESLLNQYSDRPDAESLQFIFNTKNSELAQSLNRNGDQVGNNVNFRINKYVQVMVFLIVIIAAFFLIVSIQKRNPSPIFPTSDPIATFAQNALPTPVATNVITKITVIPSVISTVPSNTKCVNTLTGIPTRFPNQLSPSVSQLDSANLCDEVISVASNLIINYFVITEDAINNLRSDLLSQVLGGSELQLWKDVIEKNKDAPFPAKSNFDFSSIFISRIVVKTRTTFSVTVGLRASSNGGGGTIVTNGKNGAGILVAELVDGHWLITSHEN